jgi:Phage phiEco32-like COOH.NH2 ligase-type 2
MPLPIGEGYAVQEDNVAIEFNIPPASSAAEFVASIQKTLTFLSDDMQERYGYKIVNVSAASFLPEELDNPAALEFGCEPDYNAWTSSKNPRPKAGNSSLRSCGGHIHIGFDRDVLRTEDVIKSMDLHVGIPSILMDNGELRKQLYGKAGAYRDKPYGGEYRTPSNFWIFKESLINWAWNNTVRAVTSVGSQIDSINADGVLIQQAINNNDRALASFMVDKYKLEVLNV